MVVIVIVVVALGIILSKSGVSNSPTTTQNGDPKLISDNAVNIIGTKGAKVTITEFGDFECPACGEAEPVVKQILTKYKDNSNFAFVFRNFPLTSIHPNAMISAEAAEAAGAQGKYWQMHDLLYAKQSEWATSASPMDVFVKYAQQIGLDINKFQSEVQQNKYQSVIQTDVTDGNALSINATPTFYINNQIDVGVPNASQFESIIDADLAK